MTKLSVGFLIDKTNKLPAWEYDTLVELLKATFVLEVLLIQSTFLEDKKIFPSKKPIILRLYQRFENIWFRKWPDAANRIDLHGLLMAQDKLRLLKVRNEKEFASLKIGLLYISQSMKDVSIPIDPPFGKWYVQFGASNFIVPELPAFWEVMNNDITTKAQLIVIRGKGIEKEIVYDAVATTIPFSIKNNFNSIAWKASLFLILRLRKLYRLGPERFFEQAKNPGFEEFALNCIERFYPSNLAMFKMILRNFLWYLIYKRKTLIKKNKFGLYYSLNKLVIGEINVNKFTQITPPVKDFWADPFVVKYEDDYYVFFEQGIYPGYKGQLAVIRINQDGLRSASRVILEKPYHLSYPFIFENNGDYYLIPESSANKTVELYCCVKFPYEWEFARYLMKDLILQDSTLFFYNNLWWLFGTTKTNKSGSSNDQLMLYYSQDFNSSDWISHPGNPVITDVTNCRPAGKIFIENDRIFRPAQNNASRQYGYSLKINEIEVLTTTEFKEKEIFEISPEVYRKYKAIHTLNSTPDIILIDGINA
jgi:hypothetical protein